MRAALCSFVANSAYKVLVPGDPAFVVARKPTCGSSDYYAKWHCTAVRTGYGDCRKTQVCLPKQAATETKRDYWC